MFEVGVDGIQARRLQSHWNERYNYRESVMRGPLKALATVVALAAVMTLSLDVAAQDAAKSGDDGEGYGYEFEDDPLSANAFGPNDATIRVR